MNKQKKIKRKRKLVRLGRKEIEEELKDLKLKCSRLEAHLEKVKRKCSDLEAQLLDEKAKVLAAIAPLSSSDDVLDQALPSTSSLSLTEQHCKAKTSQLKQMKE
ncbi:predicted protein [Arabidopsis lyrata subsp. lyrata]|uniref:Predicted protein n=1 Tax=Arabidopsis lyrata subsp. lyrata TaxID=81972 RepID=D7LID5_ARALL|nr:predicted protein [Arabidopsis lyrata subsp. lyrata]